MTDVALTRLQQDLLRQFFVLPESKGFVLAGGAGLVASGLSERPTQDVDLFGGDPRTGVAAAADALEAACVERGWTTERMQDSRTFRRIVVRTVDDVLLVDLAVDSPPMGAPTITAFGPASRCLIAPQRATSSISTSCRDGSISIDSSTSLRSSTKGST